MQFIPGGFGFAGQFFGAIAAGLFFIVVVVVVLGVLFVLVRFLMAATRAAETYVRVHELPKDETVVTAPDAPAAKSADAKTPDAPTAKAPATTPPVPAASSTSAATTPLPTVTKPVTKTPRTPKAPPPAI